MFTMLFGFFPADDVVEAIENQIMNPHKVVDGGKNPEDDHLKSDTQRSKEFIGTSKGGRERLQIPSKESVLLFPGAIVTKCEELESPQSIVVHCDECQREIKGKIFSCKTCFDFDLCADCYLNASLKHADGKHEFLCEC